jgi:hypothetical protein
VSCVVNKAILVSYDHTTGVNLMTQQSTTPNNPNEKATTPAATPSTPEKTPAPAHTPEVKKASDQKN